MTRLAIIGTAGRKEDARKLTLPVWNDMKRTIARFVKEHGIKHVVSGGAAGADHLSVGLYLAGLVDHLDLALPAPFDMDTGFLDNDSDLAFLNPGKVCTFYHEPFSRIMGIDSINQIKQAITKGAKITVEAGFDARNTIVAQADTLIAFTFGEGAVVKRGGTWKTVKRYLDRGGKLSYHVDLATMTVYSPALLS